MILHSSTEANGDDPQDWQTGGTEVAWRRRAGLDGGEPRAASTQRVSNDFGSNMLALSPHSSI